MSVRTGLLAAVLLVALSGCSPPTAEKAADAPAAPAAPTPTPAVAAKSPEEIAAALATLPAPYSQGDYANGRRVFAQCRSCHTLGEGEPNRVGPNLHGMFGAKAGQVEGFAYSDVVKNSGIVWDGPTLEKWLESPQTFLKGNRMAFVGVKKPEDRRDVIAYIKIETTK
jgi:cytochrome c